MLNQGRVREKKRAAGTFIVFKTDELANILKNFLKSQGVLVAENSTCCVDFDDKFDENGERQIIFRVQTPIDINFLG